jgi:DNA-directed RNA polymerase specialized sigma24 family protein
MMGQLTRNEVFTLAVQKYSDAVYRAAMHNSRCAADAEDVVQDVYEKLHRITIRFRIVNPLETLLLTICPPLRYTRAQMPCKFLTEGNFNL